MLGHWKLQGGCEDCSGRGNHGINHGVDLSDQGAAEFDGNCHYIEVPNSRSLAFGASDFSITAWVRCDGRVRSVPGDILSKFDPASRKGVNLQVTASSPGYSSLSDARNLQFGIDNAVEGEWEDCGRPWPSNTLISTLIVYDGRLYTGIADAAAPEDTCHMFRYVGGQEWVDCGRVGGTNVKNVSVHSVVVHKGELYAGTSIWDWEKFWRGHGAVNCDPAEVYRYEGGTEWSSCGKLGTGHVVQSLASYDGELYASEELGRLYQHLGRGKWVLCGEPGYIQAMMPYQGHLYGAIFSGENRCIAVCRYGGGSGWTNVGEVFREGRAGEFGVDQLHTLAVCGGRLHAGTWPDGKIMRYDGGQAWTDIGCVGIDPSHKRNEVNDLTVYNGMLYAGAIPQGELWRYDGGTAWTRIRRLVENPDLDIHEAGGYSWNRLPCMTIFRGRLYCGTSTCHGRAEAAPKIEVGKVFSWEAGKSVSYDHDLGTEWRHLAAVREHNYLRLYVDGKLVGTSSAFHSSAYDLSNGAPLLIGFGAEGYFSGGVRDVRLYGGAVTGHELAAICAGDQSTRQ